jgi:hypothetical protein
MFLQANALATWRVWHLQRTTALLSTVAYRMQHRAQQRTTAAILKAWRSDVQCDKLRALALRNCAVFKQKAVYADALSKWRSKVHESNCRCMRSILCKPGVDSRNATRLTFVDMIQ